MFAEQFANVRTKSPLIHNITNYVTVNDCANMVLACGKPVNIMYASTQDIGGTAFGQMVLQLPEDEESIARIQAYVKEHGLYLEEFTHA